MARNFSYCVAELAAFFVIVVSITRAQAQELNSDLVLDPLVISARGIATPVSETPGGVGVIENEDIELRQPFSIPNVVNLVPGVSKSSDSAWGSDINIRGRSRDSVVFLIDGCRVNTANDINAQYGLIEPEEVERIEILKGPISSLYGSGSIGGVVNVLTRTGHFTDEPKLSGGISSSVGSNPEGYSEYGYVLYDSPEYYVYGSQSYRMFHSYEDGEEQVMRNSQFEDYQTKFKVGRKFGDLNRTEAQVQYYEGKDIGIPGSGTAPLPTAADVTYPAVRRGLASLLHTYTPQDSVLTQSQLNLYYQYIDRRSLIDNFPAASPMEEIKPRADHDTVGGRWENQLALGAHRLVFGPDIWNRSITSDRVRQLKSGAVVEDIPLPDADFLSSGVYAEDSWQVTDPLKVSSGARIDYINVNNEATPQFEANTEEESSWNGHFGATYALSEEWSLKGLLARGYRAASLEERFAFLDLGNGVTKFGDPNLDPERSYFYEVGVNWNRERFSSGLSVFYNDLKNLIAERVVSPTTIVNSNYAEAEIQGIELESKAILTDGWQLYGNLAYAEGRDTLEHEDLPSIPPLHGLVGTRVEAGAGYYGLLETVFAAEQNEVPKGVSEGASWETINLRVGRKFKLGFLSTELYAGVDNLFDKAYRDYLSTSRGFTFNEPGRNFFGGIRMLF